MRVYTLGGKALDGVEGSVAELPLVADPRQQWDRLKVKFAVLADSYNLCIYLYRVDPATTDWLLIITNKTAEIGGDFAQRIDTFRIEMHCLPDLSVFHEISFCQPTNLFLRLNDPAHLG